MRRLKHLCVARSATVLLGGAQSAFSENPVMQLDVGELTIFQQYGEFVKFQLKNRQLIQISDGVESPYSAISWSESPIGVRVSWELDAKGGKVARTFRLLDMVK
ncbi:hypothetical protein FAZ69_19595 [Trinickia terrae]|uniref:Uncharacterized protein n=1 Tax=Trinickia terrae TaxID=2571161 RepID=A0A4U1I157_9BURK|nr:hypothetical protein [Trinickia terrae]TKC86845.1 hypothetical protein FAZ69_19595 [Trinickia terrae]